jgi:hypothetical protein
MTMIAPSADPYLAAAQEDRCAPRTRIDVTATLRASGSPRFSVTVKDLSLAGFACDAVSGMRSGTICWLTLPGLESLQAEVIWNDGATIGCAFAKLLNPAVHTMVIARYG